MAVPLAKKTTPKPVPESGCRERLASLEGPIEISPVSGQLPTSSSSPSRTPSASASTHE
jgi:hypothetical protein